MRYIAQRLLTGEFLDWNVPLTKGMLGYSYSGPDSITGTIPADFAHLKAKDSKLLRVLEPWSTAIYAEDDSGTIRAGGIVETLSVDNTNAYSLECRGFAGYPNGIIYTGHFSKTKLETLDAVREMWKHIQSKPKGDIGMTVDSHTKTKVLLGNTKDDEDELEPYILEWWDNVDCGAEIDKLAKATPFGYRERHQWNDGKTDVDHFLDFGHPILGSKREGDVFFEQGVNVTSVITPRFQGGEYANEAIGLGKGEGDKIVRSSIPNTTERIRRTMTFQDDTVDDKKILDKLTRDELLLYRDPLEITGVDVTGTHKNSRFGTFRPGDTVEVIAEIPRYGSFRKWYTITGFTYQVATKMMSVDLENPERFASLSGGVLL